MNPCSAPWYELNLNAADDNSTACCYYDGERDALAVAEIVIDGVDQGARGIDHLREILFLHERREEFDRLVRPEKMIRPG